MKSISKKRITEDLHVPEKYIGNYRRYIILKCLLFAVILTAILSVAVCLSRFSVRSGFATVLLVMLVSTYVVGYSMDMHLMFRKTWVGSIENIEYKNGPRKTDKWNDIYYIDIMVHLYVTPEGSGDTKEIILGNCKDSTYSRRLRALGLNESSEGSFDKNPFYVKMPYRTGDTLLFLRGLKYPMRVLIDGTDELQYVVCPYCGDCFKINTDNCPRCHRTLIYSKNRE